MQELSPHASFEAIAPARQNLIDRVTNAPISDVEAGFLIELQQMREDFNDLFRRLGHKPPPGERSPFIVDGRFVSIAMTHFQEGCMALERAILRPTSF